MFLHAFEVLNQSFDTSCWRLQQAASDNCIQPCAEMCAIIINMATAMDHLWLCVTFECRTCNKSLKFFKKTHPAESCGEIINRCMPDDHIACKIIEIRAQGSGTGSGGSVSCEVDTPSAVLADFGSKNLGVIVEETSRDLGAVPDQACETKLPSAFDVLMGMRRSYTHLPKPRFVSSVNVYTSTHQAYR